VSEEFAARYWRRIAGAVLEGSLGLQRGRSVIVETWAHTVPAADALAMEARRRGIRPLLLHVPARFFEVPKGTRPSDAFAVARPEIAAASATDGYILLPALTAVSEQRASLPESERRALALRQQAWVDLLVRHSVPSVYLMSASVTPENARRFRVNLRAWQRESLRATLVSSSLLRRKAAPIAERIRSGRRVRITHPNGTHLELHLAGRPAYVDDAQVDRHDLALGRIGTTVPGGFLTVAVDERSADGCFLSNRPSRTRRGRLDGVGWTFHDGRLVDYEVRRGRAIFEEAYRAAGPERDRPALFEIGLNPEIHDFPFAEDQEDGVLTLDIGRNEDFGGRTRGRFRGYAILRGADVEIDGRPILRAGRPV